jgi:hypothetical protein
VAREIIMLKALTSYLLAAMTAWMPMKSHARSEAPEVTEARYQQIAADIAEVVLDPDEEPLFKGEDGRVKTGLLLLAVAFHESNFRGDIDGGRCRPFECDHGKAFSMWQLHPEDGLTFEGDVFTFARNRSTSWREEHASEIFDGQALVRDRKIAARMALHMLRYSMKNAHSLAIYTGEPGNGPKAKLRMETALSYIRQHPFTQELAAAE